MATMDLRIDLVFGPAAAGTSTDALLLEGSAEHTTAPAASFTAAAGHPADCRCCATRNPAGRALASLLQDRARGRIPFFTRVIAVTHTAQGRAAIIEALTTDPVASSCFKLAP